MGRAKREWLAKFLDLSRGIPSHDRLNATFAAIKPAEFEKDGCQLVGLYELFASNEPEAF